MAPPTAAPVSTSWVLRRRRKPAPVAEKETPPGRRPASRGRPEQARKDADAAMSDLLDVRPRVDPMAPAEWGGGAWSNAVAEAAQGDQAYMAEVSARLRRSRRANAPGRRVGRAAGLRPACVRRVRRHRPRRPRKPPPACWSAALSIRPGDAAVTKLTARATTAAEVGGHLRAGAEQEAAGQLELAYAAYTEALRLDAGYPGEGPRASWPAGHRGAAKLMTDGLAAYRAGKLEDARGKFLEAKKIRPELPEIDDALRLVEDGMRLKRLETLRGQAGTLEAAEDYEPALKLYNEALAIDPALAFAKEGRLRTIQGIRIGRQLDAYLAQPESLFKEATLREAQSSLDEARTVPSAGGTASYIGALGAAITAATTPVEVPVVSDGKTEVMLLRGGRFEDVPPFQAFLLPQAREPCAHRRASASGTSASRSRSASKPPRRWTCPARKDEPSRLRAGPRGPREIQRKRSRSPWAPPRRARARLDQFLPGRPASSGEERRRVDRTVR
ncbi:MAG: tetratricopeptide repeat protein [Kiritimatiellia bacterium]